MTAVEDDRKTTPRFDRAEARRVARNTRRHESEAQKRLSSPLATVLAFAIGILWTIPTLGLLITSFRPGAQSATSGWWTVFTNPDFTLGNYQEALTSGGTALTLGESFLNSLAITIPTTVFALAIAGVASGRMIRKNICP